jgi:hypothetical protein
MLKWLVGLWHKFDGWLHRRAEVPHAYYRSNLHGRHR